MKLNVDLVAQSFFFAEKRGAAVHRAELRNESQSWMSSGTCGEPGSVARRVVRCKWLEVEVR